MSGPRITRKVTVEVSKKVTEVGSVPSSVVQPSSSSSSYNPRRSVFERLGPGAVDRAKTRESYPPDKCRNWLRDGRCPYGNNCKFLHGPYSDQKPRSKSVRSIVSSGSKDRHEDSDEKTQTYHSRSQDSIEYDEEDEEQEQIKKKKRHKSEDLSDSAPKKTTKSKKKHKEEADAEDEDRKAKRKRKTHKKRDSSPKSKHRSPKEDEKDWDTKANLLKDFEQQMKDAENWEDQGGELDYDRQLELERRRQDLQRQLALMDEEDAAASAEDTAQFKEYEEEEPKKVPIVHSRLHPEPSAGTPSDDGTLPQLTTTKKKKKKKLDSEVEGTKTKKKKEASPRKKDESKRKVVAKSDEDVPVRREMSPNLEIVKNVGSSDDTELLEHHKTKKKVRKTSKSSGVRGREKHTPEPYPEASPPRERVEQPVRKRPEEEEYRRQGVLSPQLKPIREKRKSESDDIVTRRTEEGRSRKSRDTAEYYPSPDEHEDNRKVRSKVVGHARIPPSNERQRAEEERSDGRAGRRETEERVTSRDPRSPSSPGHVKREDERYVYEDAAEEPKRKRPTRPRSPVREPAREDAGYKKDGTDRDRGRHEDPHGRGPRTPPDNEEHFSPPPNQAEATRSNRFSEREKDLPRRERDMSRERGPPNDQGDPRYPDRGGRVHPDGDFERRRPRDEEVSRSRRQPPKADEYPRGRPQDDDHPRYRGRDEDFPKDTRDIEFLRHREGREGRDDDFQRPKYREDKPEEYPPRSRARGERDEGEFVRGRGRDDRGDEGRGRPPPRDVQRRLHDEVEGNERDLRDERGRARPEGYIDSRSRERPDDRARDPRYGTHTPEHFRRPSPSQGPPRGRSPLHRYDDRRRIDDGYRGGPGGRDAPVGRGRGYADRGRGEYSSPYDSRGRAMDTRRRTPPLGPRSSFQDRDRGPPRGRDMPAGRGRGYVDKTRPPPNDRYRDTGVPWERRADRDYRDHRKPFVEPGIRERHPRDSSPPQQGFRDQRSWEERDRRGSPLRGGNIPPQERRPPFDADHDVRGRTEPRERRSLEPRGPGWEYVEDVNKRKRARPTTAVSSRPGSPFESKKLREQSPADFNADDSLADIPAAPEEPIRTKKTAVTTKKIKKKKLGKKEGKTAKVGVLSDGSIEPTACGVEEGKIIKVEKKQKKEKKMKGGKKKKKVVVAAVALGDTVTATAAVEEPSIAKKVAPETTTAAAAPKLGKKRKQAIASEGEQPVEYDAEKPKKKKKKKYQPEVVVQPWADLEEEDEVTMEEKKVQEDKETKEDDKEDKPLTTEKSADEMFSDWSDGDSPLGDDNWIDENEQMSPSEKKIDDDAPSAPAAPAKSSPSSEERGPSFDDVYDPISDDEFEAMYTQSDEEEEEKKEQKDRNKGLGIEDVDWSSLGLSLQPEKEKEPGSHLEKFTPGHVFSRIGISPNLAGQRLTQLVQEACAKNKTDTTSKHETGNELSIPEEGPKCIGAFVAAAAAKRREREALLGNLGPCRRALCARRDLSIRKQLGRSSKFDKVALFAASQSTPVGPPVDNELFQMSVALYNKDSTNTEISTRVIPSKVGSILLTQA